MLHKTITVLQCRCEGGRFDTQTNRIEGIWKEWPNLDNRRVRNFFFHVRKYQWKKHGKCVAKLRGIIEDCWDYFEEAMRIARRINERLDQWLNVRLFPAGFPNVARNFSYQLIRDSIERIYPHRAIIFSYDVHQPDGQIVHWIESISFCFDLWLRPINCSSAYQEIPGHQLGYFGFFSN